MLHGLLDDAVVACRTTGIQGLEEGAQLAAAAQLAHAGGRVAERAGHPAQHHLPVAPALDVAGVAGHRAVQVLDGVGRAQRAVRRPGDAQCLDGQRLLEALAQTGRGTGVPGLQRRCQTPELLARQIGVRGRPGVLQSPLGAAVHVLGQVHLAELYEAARHRALGGRAWPVPEAGQP